MDINRKTAMEILLEIENNQAYSNIALNIFIKKNRPDSQGLVREIVYGVLKNKMFIDFILAKLTTAPLKKIKTNALIILRMGLYQLIFMGSVPEYAAVNESVALASKFAKGQKGFVNAILRAYIRQADSINLPDKSSDPALYYSIKYSCPQWIVKQWLSSYPEDFTEALLKAGNETPPLCIRTNLLKTDRETLKKSLTEAGYEVESGSLSSVALHVKGSNLLDSDLYKNGWFSVQDESSMIAVENLDPQPGELVIDVCAAPGGKTLYAGELMKNKGSIIAFDIHDHKLKLLVEAAKRDGVLNIETLVWDSKVTYMPLKHQADRVLVDAPCSGLGVLRRKPEIKYVKDNDMIKLLPDKQFELLSASSDYVKPEGWLVYTTCTISKAENQAVVERFLESNKNFVQVEQRQLFPNIEGTDGFFICTMRKKK